MRAKITKRGLVVPREMLPDVDEVEIRKEDHRVVISPLPREDPILGLGKHPVKCGITDASERHDSYLYGS
ncbi:MAG: hypothetical protein AB1664_08930 [Thermodesulfobacteriota bacterium]